jgi:hypothetical protein
VTEHLDPTGGQPQPTLSQQWETEQQNWQQMLLSYADSASADEQFLVHIGNAMRGSLMAGRPYPGSTLDPPGQDKINSTMANDEVVFALRRLEGQVGALTAALDDVARRLSGSTQPGNT